MPPDDPALPPEPTPIPPLANMRTTDLLTAGLGGIDLAALTLTEIIQLQNQLSRILKRRFERERALAFTDVVGSTAYFNRYGDEAGRRLVQRHLDLVKWAVDKARGRIVDTAGDGAFTCFETVDDAVNALIELQRRNAAANASQAREHRLRVRAGIHWGSVLADDTYVTGDAVNFCARVASTSQPGEIRLSGDAFRVLSSRLRVRCRTLPRATYKGIDGEHDQWSLAWTEQTGIPHRIRIEETGQERPLPPVEIIRFGRLAEIDGKVANEVVLELPDPALTQKISRWHFELERLEDGRLRLRQGSGQLTEIDGVPVPKGGTAPVAAGSVVRIGGVLTITFIAEGGGADAPVETLF